MIPKFDFSVQLITLYFTIYVLTNPVKNSNTHTFCWSCNLFYSSFFMNYLFGLNRTNNWLQFNSIHLFPHHKNQHNKFH